MFGCREKISEQPGEEIAIPVTFKDYLTSLRKKLVENKLKRVSKGLVKTGYPMRISKR